MLKEVQLSLTYDEGFVCSYDSMIYLRFCFFHNLALRHKFNPVIICFISGWTVRGSNPGVGNIFRTRPDRPWGSPSLLYNGHRVCFSGKSARGVALTTPSSNAEVKDKIYPYSLLSLHGLFQGEFYF